jgi:hypothetical protein
MGRLLSTAKKRARGNLEPYCNPEDRPKAWALDSPFQITDECPVQSGPSMQRHLRDFALLADHPHGLPKRLFNSR